MTCNPITILNSTTQIIVADASTSVYVNSVEGSLSVGQTSGSIAVTQSSSNVTVIRDTSNITVTGGTPVFVNNSAVVPALTSPFTAGEAIQAFDVVVAFGNVVRRATVADVTHVGNVVGIALASASIGEAVNIVTHGRISNPAWSFNDALPVYLSSLPGQLVQDDVDQVDGATFSIRIGTVRDPDTVDVNIQPDILY